MAYPIARFGTPKTPQHFDQGPDDSPRDSPREKMPRPSGILIQYKQYLLATVTFVLLLLWIRFSTSSSTQADRIPFTHDPIEE